MKQKSLVETWQPTRLWQTNLLISLVFVAIYNLPFWNSLLSVIDLEGWSDVGFLLSVSLLLIVVINLVLTLLVVRRLAQWMYGLLLLVSAGVSYYISQYHIYVDQEMIRNVLQTNAAETSDLLSIELLWYVLLLGVLPWLLLRRLDIKPVSWRLWLAEKLSVLVVSSLMLAVLLYLNYPTYASLARTERQLSHQIIPTNFLFATASLVRDQLSQQTASFQDISQDAHRPQKARTRKQLMVVVVGETARADHFSLNGYARLTNPKLQNRELINFARVQSCGTSTAVSLPCLFSNLTRKEYSHQLSHNSSNLLDFFQAAGFKVQWRDNNTGCKGLCDRVEFHDMTHSQDALCGQSSCFDEVLLKGLREQIMAEPADQLIVLHQLGSHGPAYHLRYPQQYARFTPACQETQLQKCSEEALHNSYDNTIVYTDHLIDAVIELMESLPEELESAMIYVSDHGESLGENNLYLHGTPYFMAPQAQTHVPLMFWSSEHSSQTLKLDQDCLKSKQSVPLSHDYFFHSMLGLMHINTAYYREDLDVFASCRLSTDPVWVAENQDLAL
jgi:lipid A ethanolaminephosphotransferase